MLLYAFTRGGKWCIEKLNGEYVELTSELMSATQSNDGEKKKQEKIILGEAIRRRIRKKSGCFSISIITSTKRERDISQLKKPLQKQERH